MIEYPYHLSLKFYDVAGRSAQRTMLRYPDGKAFSFSDMNRLSNRTGRYLSDMGIRKGDVVAIFNEKSPLAFSVMLGCIKIGAIYTNLDITSPWARIEKILNTCQPNLIFIDKADNELTEACKKAFPATPLVDLRGASFEAGLGSLDDADIMETVRDINGSDAVYIMFTSGSTGFPKGAVMSHSNVLNFIQW